MTAAAGAALMEAATTAVRVVASAGAAVLPVILVSKCTGAMDAMLGLGITVGGGGSPCRAGLGFIASEV